MFDRSSVVVVVVVADRISLRRPIATVLEFFVAGTSFSLSLSLSRRVQPSTVTRQMIRPIENAILNENRKRGMGQQHKKK